MTKHLLILALAIIGVPIRAQRSVPPDTVVTLQREADAFGNGGFYIVTISADGTVKLTRSRNPTRQYDPNEPDSKVINSRITTEKLAELLAEARRINYFSLKDRYAKTDDGCPGVIIDQGGAATSITTNGKTKSIAHYHGCRRTLFDEIFPVQLTQFERKIDDIVGTTDLLKQ